MIVKLIWGVFLVAVGATMVLFNKQWVERTAPYIRIRLALADRPHLTAVIIGLALIAAGALTIVGVLNGSL